MIKVGHDIRAAQPDDLEAITAIYNFAILSKFQTADTKPYDWKKRKGWFKSHTKNDYPIFVYEVNGTVVGWISLSPYRKGRQALRFTIEVSYYVHPEFQQKGIGSTLLHHALQKSRELHYKTVVAILLDKNEISIKLLLKFGFSKCGHLPNVADFEGSECSHLYYGLRI